tara:strand:- start:436 stop:1962 length:1527 start_codon:yes stop_codon:yes gene_type:complete
MASSFLKPFAKPAQEVGERIFKGVVGDGATQVVPELARRTKLINDLNETFAPKLGAKTRKPQRRAIAAAINNGDLEPDMADKLLRDFDDEGYEFFADAQIEKQMQGGRDSQLEGMLGDTPTQSEGPFQQINKQEAKATTVPDVNTELSEALKGGNEEQIMSTLNTEGWQGLNDEYRFLYPEEIIHNPELLEGLAARQDVQEGYFSELSKNLDERTRLQELPKGHPDLKTDSGRDTLKGVGKNIKYNDRAGKDAASLNLLTRDQDVFKVNRAPLKQALEVFNLGEKGNQLEWHHTFFGNKEGGSIFLEKVTQEPMVALNLMALLKKLDLPTSGTIGNLSLLREADHTKLHQIFRELGLEQGGDLDFADYMKAIGDAYLDGTADVNQFFRMLEVYAEEVVPLTQSKTAQFDNLPFAQSGIADELKNYASIPDKKTKRKIVSKKSTNKKMVQGPRKGKMKSSPKAKTIASIPGVMYKGSGKDPAVNELLKKLKKDGAGSLDSSGMGTRWKV